MVRFGRLWRLVTSCGGGLLLLAAEVRPGCGLLWRPEIDLAGDCYPYNPIVQERETRSIESFDVAGLAAGVGPGCGLLRRP